MAAGKNYDMTVYPVQVAVRSQSDGVAVHLVTLPYCDCADFTNRKGKSVLTDAGRAVTVCKHLTEALERVGGWHHEPPREPLVFRDQTRAQAANVLAAAGVTSEPATSTAFRDVHSGAPFHLPRDGQPSVKLEVDREHPSSRYTVTVP
jgi:hypothetical protein